MPLQAARNPQVLRQGVQADAEIIEVPQRAGQRGGRDAYNEHRLNDLVQQLDEARQQVRARRQAAEAERRAEEAGRVLGHHLDEQMQGHILPRLQRYHNQENQYQQQNRHQAREAQFQYMDQMLDDDLYGEMDMDTPIRPPVFNRAHVPPVPAPAPAPARRQGFVLSAEVQAPSR
jgi:hypothetical protein